MVLFYKFHKVKKATLMMELRSLYRGVLVILSSLQYTVWRLTCMSWWTNNGTRGSKVLGTESECSKCCEYVNMWMCECVNVVNIVHFFEYCKNNSKILEIFIIRLALRTRLCLSWKQKTTGHREKWFIDHFLRHSWWL